MKKLTKGKIYRFFTADIAKGFFNGMIGNYLLYFYQPSSTSGIMSLLPENKFLGFITVMALITAIGKILDAISDPIVAQLSDRCKSKYGRRMPFLRIGAIPYALCVLLVFMAPFNAGSAWNAVWVGIFLVLYYTAYTIFYIPHRALVPEIIPDPKERVGYYAVSTAFFMGTSALMYAAPAFVNIFKNTGVTTISAWRCVFAIFALIGMVCLLISAFAFHEPDYVQIQSQPTDSVLKSFKIVLKNKDFVIFSLGDLASYISMAFFQSSLMYYITDLLHIDGSLSFVVMGLAIVASICMFPLIVKLSKKFGKKTPLIIGTWIFAGVFTFIFFGDDIASLVPGYELLLGIGMGLTVSFPFACINILPQSMLSDIIQQDTIVSGVRREGIFSAIKTFIDKIAYAVAMIIVSSVLAIGATPGQPAGLLGIKLTGIFACAFSIISVILFMIYNDKNVTDTIENHNKTKENN